MGFFSNLSKIMTDRAIRTMKAYESGRADIVEAQAALKALANGGKLFKRRGYSNSMDLESYYWVNGNELENIRGDKQEVTTINGNEIRTRFGNTFQKVVAAECDHINFSRY